MLENPWGITAYGAADVKATPDLVRIRFKVIRLEQTPSESFAAGTSAVQAVRQALREHGVPDVAVDRSRLDLQSSWEYGSGKRKFRGYECTAAYAVESRDLDGIQTLLVDLVAAGANEIGGVDFDVIGKPELRAEARRKAVAAARRKAELYAEAAGVRVGSLLHIDDVDPESMGRERYRGHGSDGEPTAQDLAPGQVIVSAAVVLGFSISH